MIKNEMAKELARRIDIDNFGQAEAINVINTLVEIMCETLENGEDIVIRDFAGLEPVVRKARIRRANFRNGSGVKMLVPARRDVRIRLFKKFKERLNNQS